MDQTKGQVIEITAQDILVSIQARQEEIEKKLVEVRAKIYEYREKEHALAGELKALGDTINRAVEKAQSKNKPT